MSILANGVALWTDAPTNAAASALTVVLVTAIDGAGNPVYATSGVPVAVWVDWQGVGVPELVKLTPAAIIADGADLLVTATPGAAPLAAVLTDDGAGNVVPNPDLTQPIVADILPNVAGDLIIVPRTCRRWTTVRDASGTIYKF